MMYLFEPTGKLKIIQVVGWFFSLSKNIIQYIKKKDGACELLEDRAKLFENNFPECKCFVGDIWNLKEDIIKYYQNKYKKNPFLIIATPPCQGMSSNGMGKKQILKMKNTLKLINHLFLLLLIAWWTFQSNLLTRCILWSPIAGFATWEAEGVLPQVAFISIPPYL